MLLLLVLLVPVGEIWLLIEVGRLVGAGWTAMLVVLTAVMGAALVRIQGLATLARVRTALAAGALPATELIQGVGILVAGVLLLTPGFITDCAGFALLFPPLRRSLAGAVLAQELARGRRPVGGRTLEGEFRRTDD